MTDMTEREAFEEYFKRELWDKCMGSAHGPNFMFADDKGDYYHGAMNIAWDAWQKRGELVGDDSPVRDAAPGRVFFEGGQTFVQWLFCPLFFAGPVVGWVVDAVCLLAYLLITEPVFCWRWQRVARWRLRRLLRDVMRGDT